MPRFLLNTALVVGLVYSTLCTSPIQAQDDASCTVTSTSTINRREGPGTDFSTAGVLSPGEIATVTAQTPGSDGYTWWQLEDGSWVRADVVNEQGNCTAVPLAGAEPTAEKTCDGGPNDALAAAQTSYASGDLATAFELALSAQTICQVAGQNLGYLNAVFLARKITAERHPNWPTVRIANHSVHDVCTVLFEGATLTWGANVTWLEADNVPLKPGQTAEWKLPPGTYDIKLLDCQARQVGEAKGVEISLSKTLNFGTPASGDWTCDGSSQDIVSAAVASFQNGDLEEADRLATLAEQICTDGERRARLGVLRWNLDQQLHPEWPTVQIISLFQQPVCGLAFGRSDLPSTLPIPSVLGRNRLELLHTVSFRAASGVYAIGAFDCENQRVANAVGIRVEEDTVLTIGPDGVSIVPTLESSSLPGVDAPATQSPMPTQAPTTSPAPIATSVASGLPILTINNTSTVSICHLVLIPQGAEEDQGQWLVAEYEIPPGYQRQYPTQPGVYSVVFMDCNNQALYAEKDLDITTSTTFTYSGQTPPEPVNEEWLTNQLARLQEGLALVDTAHYAEALQIFNEVLALAQERNVPALEAAAHNNIGTVYQYQGNYSDALDHFLQARTFLESYENDLALGTTLNNIAVVYRALGRYDEALQTFEEVIILQDRTDTPAPMKAGTLSNIGQVYQEQGIYAQALDYFYQAEAMLRDVQAPLEYGRILSQIGITYVHQGLYDEALSYLNRALEQHKLAGDRVGEASTLNTIGTVEYSVGQFEQALDTLDQSLRLRREIGDKAGEAITLNNIATVYLQFQRFDDAQPYLLDAETIAEAIGDIPSLAWVKNNLGVVAFGQGHLTDALEYFQESLSLRRTVGDRPGEILTLTNIGAMYEVFDQPADSIDAYREAVDAIEYVLSDAALDAAIAGLASQIQNSWPYQRLAVLLTRQGEPTAALSYAERGRSVLARTDLAIGSIDFRARLDADLLATEAELRLTLDKAQRYLDNLHRDASATDVDIRSAQSTVDTVRQTYEQHLSVMQLQGGYLSREIARGVASLNEIQAALSPDTTLLLYTLGNPNSSVFIVTVSGLDAVVLDAGQEQIGEVIAPFVADHQANAGALRDLYDLIFAPIADRITTSRLIIVPDGALNYVPFAALQAPDGQYLIDDYSISMVSSATTLVLLHDRAQQAQADPTSPALVLAQPAAPGLPTLRNAPLEALDVADLLSVEPNLNATEADLRTQATGSQVLYITTHTELDHFAPLFSVIHLGEGGDYDGRLEVREIYELDLSQGTELVVLSGCETASGGTGEDFGLLTRAFFAAGAPRVVASLWRVDDAATADLMTAFIAERANYDNDADALRAAMLVTREQYPEPYYWASFVLSGLP